MESKDKCNNAGFEKAIQLEEGKSQSNGEAVPALESPLRLRSPSSTLAPNTPSVATRMLFISHQYLETKVSLAVTKTFSWSSLWPNIQKTKFSCHVDKLEDAPLGYPQVARLLLLHKQDRLRELEEELFYLDKADSEDADPERKMLLMCRDDADHAPEPADGRSRMKILGDIETTLLEYGALMRQTHEFESMEKPTDRDHASVIHYFNKRQPLVESDRGFLRYKDDLVTIRAGREHAWLDSAVESILRWYPRVPVKYFFCDEATRKKTDDPGIHYFKRSRINFFVTLIITILILILLVVPIGVLFYISLIDTGGPGEILIVGVLLVCTLVFSCALSLFTKAKRHELLAASAGYCAVLVVFVGNVGNNVPRIG